MLETVESGRGGEDGSSVAPSRNPLFLVLYHGVFSAGMHPSHSMWCREKNTAQLLKESKNLSNGLAAGLAAACFVMQHVVLVI